MKTVREFFHCQERYHWDFEECRPLDGWAQVDTSQDASYFGTWANPFTLQTVNFLEGDLVTCTAENKAEFKTMIDELVEWNKAQGYKCAIDGMERGRIINEFKALGLGDYLH